MSYYERRLFMESTAKRSSTAVTSFAALVAVACLSLFSLGIAYFQPSPWLTLTLLPCPMLIAYAVARVVVGMPPTIMGVSGRAPSTRPGQPRYQLVAMPINHFGEKLRWCMDLLGLDYEESTVGGILSIFVRGRSVPWLVDRQSCSLIGNSDEALAYLSAVHVPVLRGQAAVAARALLSRDETTIAWEERLNALGHAIQGWGYYYLLSDKTDSDLSWRYWGGAEPHVPRLDRLALRLGYPILKGLMRRAFVLDDVARLKQRYETILSVLEEADASLEQHGGQYLTGPHLSYVDIGFCALVAPLLASTVTPLWAKGRFTSFAPLQHHPNRPAELLDVERAIRERPCGMHVERLYRDLRHVSFAVVDPAVHFGSAPTMV
jgi:glutathione S-transferase